MARQLWRDIIISNSLDIDFIHSDIRSWLCKKYWKSETKKFTPSGAELENARRNTVKSLI